MHFLVCGERCVWPNAIAAFLQETQREVVPRRRTDVRQIGDALSHRNDDPVMNSRLMGKNGSFLGLQPKVLPKMHSLTTLVKANFIRCTGADALDRVELFKKANPMKKKLRLLFSCSRSLRFRPCGHLRVQLARTVGPRRAFRERTARRNDRRRGARDAHRCRLQLHRLPQRRLQHRGLLRPRRSGRPLPLGGRTRPLGCPHVRLGLTGALFFSV